MCGIAGELRPVTDRSPALVRQLESLRHRGADAEGVYERDGVGIGQTRLAIIDLDTGDPPITNEDGSVGVVLNGEVYNYQSLRNDLRKRGHSFRSEGDTEVIAHLAEEVEPAALAGMLHGMFAFAVWDDRRRRLILGRDRFGKKPLYYWTDNSQRLVFGSEIKALLCNRHVPRRLREEAIPGYLTFGYVPTPRTFFEGILSLPPGHVLTIEPGQPPRVERYWAPPIAGVTAPGHLDMTLDQAAREVRTRLKDAVRRRLISDVPLGAFLSGGVDSSAVVGLMAQELDEPVQTFTIGFDDREGYDERPFARLAARRHRTDHHEFVVQPNAVDLVEKLVWHHDQPFGDHSAIPTYLLSELTRQRVTVALSGDGGDELFAGYERFAAGVAAASYAALPRFAQAITSGTVHLLPPRSLGGRASSLRRFVRVAQKGLPDAFRSWISYVGDRERQGLLNGHGDDEALTGYRGIWSSSMGAPTLDRLLDLNLRTYLLDDLLIKTDRMSMAHGLEVRCPFLDPELQALTSRLHPHLKARGLSLKRVLRAAVSDLLPVEILNRPKRGFGVPLDRWFREDLKSYVAGTLGKDASIRRYLSPQGIDCLLTEHELGVGDHGHALWTLLTLEVFLRREGW